MAITRKSVSEALAVRNNHRRAAIQDGLDRLANLAVYARDSFQDGHGVQGDFASNAAQIVAGLAAHLAVYDNTLRIRIDAEAGKLDVPKQ